VGGAAQNGVQRVVARHDLRQVDGPIKHDQIAAGRQHRSADQRHYDQQRISITADKRSGVGDWSDAQLASYLSPPPTRRIAVPPPDRWQKENSLQYPTSEDIPALVAYLRTVAAQSGVTP
jgi:hypothetical protein